MHPVWVLEARCRRFSDLIKNSQMNQDNVKYRQVIYYFIDILFDHIVVQWLWLAIVQQYGQTLPWMLWTSIYVI